MILLIVAIVGVSLIGLVLLGFFLDLIGILDLIITFFTKERKDKDDSGPKRRQ